MATYDGHRDVESFMSSAPLTPGDLVEVYFWSKREWRLGRYLVNAFGRPFVAVPGSRPLRYEAARLMGLRRLVQ